jgi:formylglycine-generating enzyme required for sulfatase activity
LPPDSDRFVGVERSSGTVWEIEDALAAAGRPGAPDVLIYRKTAVASVSLGAADLHERADQFTALEEYLDGIAARRGGKAETFTTIEQFRDAVDVHLRRLIDRRLRIGHSQSSGRAVGVRRLGPTPYPGLRTFTPADSDVFFGRDVEVDALVGLVRRASLVAVVGPSGSGKSSMIAGGLIPRLSASGGRWQTPVYDADRGLWVGGRITPAGGRGDPLLALANALDQQTADVVDRDPHGRCLTAAEQTRSQGRQLLIFIDQFEEIFGSVSRPTAELFVETLIEMADARLATVVLSLRADLLGHALAHERLATRMREATLLLGPPDLASVHRMITDPARVFDLAFEENLPEQILVDVRREPGALPLMAFTLSELYRNRTGRTLTHASYEEIGGVAGAIGLLAERRMSELPEPVRAELPSLFRRLVTLDSVGGPLRRAVTLASLRAAPRQRVLVDALIAARLVVTGSDLTDTPVVELAHEALFRSWGRLTDWIDGAHSDLRIISRFRRAVSDWIASSRDPLLLWPQERMDPVVLAAERLDERFSADEQSFLRSEAERLLDELSDRTTTHLRRSGIGLRLAVLGDRRPGVGVSSDGVPDVAWCQVPSRGDQPGFWMGRYPVTAVQLAAFRRSKHTVDEPAEPSADGRVDNIPAAASWYEAMTFCDWLDGVLREKSGLGGEGRPVGVVRLPTEAEWIRASEGGAYPWGDLFEVDRANTAVSGLDRIITVGMYPRGDTTTGISDLIGNCWEWCDDAVAGQGDDGDSVRRRILKGGSAFEDPRRCTTGARQEMRGDVVRPDRGFRVCYGPVPRAGDDR